MLHDKLILPEADLLVHSGDLLNHGHFQEIRSLVGWAEKMKQEYGEVMFTPGNHDWAFAKNYPFGVPNPDVARLILEDAGWTVLIDEQATVTHEGTDYKVYGSPWQPAFFDWAFNLPRGGEELDEKWSAIPEDTDILLTHGPPFGTLDYTNMHTGCEVLSAHLPGLQELKLHVFGHIHEGYGHMERRGTHSVNASVVNSKYRPINAPIVVELSP